MKRALYILAIALTSCGAAFAQTPPAPATATRLAPAISTTRTAAAPAREPTTSAPFGCDARAPNVCHFRIFYTRGDRVVILSAGMKAKKVPATIGGDYCMTLGKTPEYKCARKVINDKYNS